MRSRGCSMMSPTSCVRLCPACRPLSACSGRARRNSAPCCHRMDREVERLDALVGEVLTLARLTAGSSRPLKTHTLDVIELLNEILGDAAFESSGAGGLNHNQCRGRFPRRSRRRADLQGARKRRPQRRQVHGRAFAHIRIVRDDRRAPQNLCHRSGPGVSETNSNGSSSRSRAETRLYREVDMAWVWQSPDRPSSAMAGVCMRRCRMPEAVQSPWSFPKADALWFG